MDEWAIGLSMGSLHRHSIFECLEPVRAAGWDWLELCSSLDHLDYRDPEAVGRAAQRIEELSLHPWSLHAPFDDEIDITAPDDARRHRARRAMLAAADAAARLGARYLVLHPGPSIEDIPAAEQPTRWGHALSAIGEISAYCRRLGLRLLLENMLPHLFLGDPEQFRRILDATVAQEAGVCLDVGHAFVTGHLARVVDELIGRAQLMHVSDNRGRHDDHLTPGDGTIPWSQLHAAWRRASYEGMLMIELAPQDGIETTLAAAQRGREHLQALDRA